MKSFWSQMGILEKSWRVHSLKSHFISTQATLASAGRGQGVQLRDDLI